MRVIPGSATIEETLPVVRAFQEKVIDTGVRPAQMVLIAFLVTFGVVRLVTHAIRRGAGPFRNLSVGGVHLHHLVPGILLLLGSGFVAIAIDPSMPGWLWWLLPTAFGVGAALTLDEFALWLNLRDVYWTEEGRRSIDAVIVASTVAGIVALGVPFWSEVLRASAAGTAWAILGYHLLSVGAAVACATKGKWVMAALGVLLWPVGLVGAVRLARPDSLWARHLYGPAEMARARRRFPDAGTPAPRPAEAGQGA